MSWRAPIGLAVMPCQGRAFEKILKLRKDCPASFRLVLLLCRPDRLEKRYERHGSFIREALDHGEALHD